MPNTTRDRSIAFLNIHCGGAGGTAAAPFRTLYEVDDRLFIMLQVHIDTDPEPAFGVDWSIPIGLDDEKVETIKANAALFGPIAATIVEHHSHFLNPEDVSNGARTTRLLTQLAFLYHRELIVTELRKCVIELLHRGGFHTIIPVILSSSGGGTGSALQILLPQALKDRSFRGRLTEGLPPGLIQTPISFVVEPFAQAMRNQTPHADKVLANAFAFRIESAILERSHAYKYIFHLGLANKHGTVLDTPEEIAKVLGTSVYQFERHWCQTKARTVDTVDSTAAFSPYTGIDIPEVVLRVRSTEHASRQGRASSGGNGDRAPAAPSL